MLSLTLDPLVQPVRCLSTGALLARVGGLGSGSGELHDPQGVALADGLLLVSEWGNHRLSVFDSNDLSFKYHIGQTLDSQGFPEEGSTPGALDQPCGVAVHGGEVFVADTWNHRISVFSLHDGSFRRCFGERGRQPGQFIYPADVEVKKGCLFVTESRGKRFQALSLEGVPRAVLDSPCEGWLHGICVDGERLWVSSSNRHQLHVFQSDVLSARHQPLLHDVDVVANLVE